MDRFGEENELQFEGILPIWKPAGLTSHDVVARVRRMLGMRRVGHTGTLDPMVTGVLPIAVGRATRVVEYIQDLPKSYEAILQFGIATDTEDLTGKVIEEAEEINLNQRQVEEALSKFRGEISQTPPMYSSVKKDGKRLYELARQGITVERKARRVEIYKLDLLDYKEHPKKPEARLSVTCSKGTYIRTLCKDIGAALGVPSVMAELIRTASGPFTLKDCMTLEEAEQLQLDHVLQDRIISIDEAVGHFPSFTLPAAEEKKALSGSKINCFPPLSSIDGQTSVFMRVYLQSGRFIGIYRYETKQNLLVPLKLFI